MTKPFMTVVDRWRWHVQASSLDTRLPPAEFALATVFFFAGFSACLDAVTEAAEYPDASLVAERATLRIEVGILKDELASIAARAK